MRNTNTGYRMNYYIRILHFELDDLSLLGLDLNINKIDHIEKKVIR